MEEVGFTSHVVGALGDIGFPIDNHSVAGQSENTLSLSEKYLILTIFSSGRSLFELDAADDLVGEFALVVLMLLRVGDGDEPVLLGQRQEDDLQRLVLAAHLALDGRDARILAGDRDALGIARGLFGLGILLEGGQIAV